MPDRTRKMLFVIIFVLGLGDLWAVEGPKAGVQDGHPALLYSACSSKLASSVTFTSIVPRRRQELVLRTRSAPVESLGNEEAFRVPVMHLHQTRFQQSCMGYIYVTPTRIVYEAFAGKNLQHGFDFQKGEVKLRTASGRREEWLHVVTAHRRYNFWLRAENGDDYIANCHENRVWKWLRLAFDDFPRARAEFAKLVPGVDVEAQNSGSTK